jgi:hypothetical protein
VEVQQATTAAEMRPEAEAQPAVPVVVALPAAYAVDSHSAPAATEVRLEAAAAAPQQEPAATEVAVARQEPALAGSSQATAVEIPDDDVPPPGWDQWASLPTSAPKPQAGALVRRWDSHMVARG